MLNIIKSNKYLCLLVSMDSGSLLMSEIVDIPDDSSPSEDSCLMEVGLRTRRERGHRNVSEGGDVGDSGEYISFRGPPSQTPESPLAGGQRARLFTRGERSNSCSSPSTATPTYRWAPTQMYVLIWEKKHLFCIAPFIKEMPHKELYKKGN